MKIIDSYGKEESINCIVKRLQQFSYTTILPIYMYLGWDAKSSAKSSAKSIKQKKSAEECAKWKKY